MKQISESFQKELNIQEIAHYDIDNILKQIEYLLLYRKLYCKHYVENKKLYGKEEHFKHLLENVDWYNTRILEILNITL